MEKISSYERYLQPTPHITVIGESSHCLDGPTCRSNPKPISFWILSSGLSRDVSRELMPISVHNQIIFHI